MCIIYIYICSPILGCCCQAGPRQFSFHRCEREGQRGRLRLLQLDQRQQAQGLDPGSGWAAMEGHCEKRSAGTKMWSCPIHLFLLFMGNSFHPRFPSPRQFQHLPSAAGSSVRDFLTRRQDSDLQRVRHLLPGLLPALLRRGERRHGPPGSRPHGLGCFLSQGPRKTAASFWFWLPGLMGFEPRLWGGGPGIKETPIYTSYFFIQLTPAVLKG